jgi:hypothetical protein
MPGWTAVSPRRPARRPGALLDNAFDAIGIADGREGVRFFETIPDADHRLVAVDAGHDVPSRSSTVDDGLI